MKKILSLLIVVMMVASAFTGCSSDAPSTPSQSGGNASAPEVKPEGEDKEQEPAQGTNETDNSGRELVINLATSVETWDPQINNNSEGAHVVLNLFEGLMRDTDDGPVLAGAESFETSANAEGVENTVYTFKLRQDAKWSDGKPVTAQDYEYAWKRGCDPVVASPSSTLITPYIKGGQEYFDNAGTRDDVAVKALDDYTLQVELNFPVSYFTELLTLGMYCPSREDVIEANGEGWEKKPELCISNGPFKLTDYKVGSHLSWAKNEYYYAADEVKIDLVKALMLEEATTGLQGYQAGEIQILDRVPMEEIPVLQAEDPNFTITPTVGVYYYTFNMDKEPTNNPLVRKALSIAIDRKQITEKVLGGGQIPATGVVPPSLNFSDGTPIRKMDEDGNMLPEYGIDPNQGLVEEAKELMKEAGYPDGAGMPVLDIVYNTSEDNKKIAQAIQQMWKEGLNVESKLRAEDWAVFGKTRDAGDFDVNRGGWSGDYADPITMLELWTSYSGVNSAQWRWKVYDFAPLDTTLNPRSKDYDELIDKMMRSSGTEKDGYIREAESIICEEERTCIPLYYLTSMQIVDEAVVEGVRKTRVGHWILRDAYWVD